MLQTILTKVSALPLLGPITRGRHSARKARSEAASQAARAIVMQRLAREARASERSQHLLQLRTAYLNRQPARFTMLALACEHRLCAADWEKVCHLGRRIAPLDPLFSAPATQRSPSITAARH